MRQDIGPDRMVGLGIVRDAPEGMLKVADDADGGGATGASGQVLLGKAKA